MAFANTTEANPPATPNAAMRIDLKGLYAAALGGALRPSGANFSTSDEYAVARSVLVSAVRFREDADAAANNNCLERMAQVAVDLRAMWNEEPRFRVQHGAGGYSMPAMWFGASYAGSRFFGHGHPMAPYIENLSVKSTCHAQLA